MNPRPSADSASAERPEVPAPPPMRRFVRMDMHCHSRASNKPVVRALAPLGIPECYSEPEQVYDQARARGMDLVTITDHDTIAGALELAERGFEDFIIGQEVSVRFPEDRCLLHVVVWGMTPAQDEELSSLGLREDVYEFADWLSDQNLPHALAHPMYVQNGRLSTWHLERCLLLFKGWEVLNGAHSGTHRGTIERYLASLTPGWTQELVRAHQLEPMGSRIWVKGQTAGSDDHGLLNVGRTWTGVEVDREVDVREPREYLRRVMAGMSVVGGVAGHSSLLAHQLAAVAAHWYGRDVAPKGSARHRYIAGTFLRMAGVPLDRPAKSSLVWSQLKRKIPGRRKRPMPLLEALSREFGPLLERHAELGARLQPEAWSDGAALSSHEQMEAFTEELGAALSQSMTRGAIKACQERDRSGLTDHLLGYAILTLAQAPYIFSLFHQNKERPMLERLDHDTAQRAGTSPGHAVHGVGDEGGRGDVLGRPMRVCLFTDTLGDVNGVCRFIQNVAHQANEKGRDLQVITSTAFDTPAWPNIHNFEPIFATKMPKYEQLEIVLPPLLKMLRFADRHQPDVIHISTPGPVGVAGYIAGRMLRVPVLGVYHTDFPAYVDHFFDDHAFTWITSQYMKWFYAPFSSIFTRSDDYMDALEAIGMDRTRMVRLMPGLETTRFNRSFRDPEIWGKIAHEPGGANADLDEPSVRVLYIGRVSVEKNLPMLAKVWPKVRKRGRSQGVNAKLVVVGDGPYRARMEEELEGQGLHTLGFRHGDELSTIYASSDLFVFPSTTDTLGQVVMESQSSGLPVVVTDQGGPREVVEHGRTGFVLKADDTDAWVDAIADLAGDEAKRRAMGSAAAESMERYDIAHSFEHFWEVHEEAWRSHLASRGVTNGASQSAELEDEAPSGLAPV